MADWWADFLSHLTLSLPDQRKVSRQRRQPLTEGEDERALLGQVVTYPLVRTVPQREACKEPKKS